MNETDDQEIISCQTTDLSPVEAGMRALTALEEGRKGAATLSPRDAERIRGQIVRAFDAVLPLAVMAMTGQLKWTPAQVSLFKAFMSRAVPEVSGKMVQVNHTSKRLDEMDLVTLQQIAEGHSEV